MVLAHVKSVSSRTDDLLEDTLRTRGGTDVVQAEDSADHGSHRGKSGLLAESDLRTDAVVKVGLIRSIEAHCFGVRECRCVMVCLGLQGVSCMRRLKTM